MLTYLYIYHMVDDHNLLDRILVLDRHRDHVHVHNDLFCHHIRRDRHSHRRRPHQSPNHLENNYRDRTFLFSVANRDVLSQFQFGDASTLFARPLVDHIPGKIILVFFSSFLVFWMSHRNSESFLEFGRGVKMGHSHKNGMIVA